MLKILSSSQSKELDEFTIKHEPIASIDLMERACHAFANWFVLHFGKEKRVGIVCGPGNNGGDGLGVARLLKDLGYSINVWIVRGDVTETENFKINLGRINGKIPVYEIKSESDRGLFDECDILIDAIFGSGLSRPASGIFAQVITCVNQTDATRVAIDIPSGLFADVPTLGCAIEAHFTITFQLPKLAFLFPENSRWVGRWYHIDIGLSREFLHTATVKNYFVAAQSIKKIIKPRSFFAHKGNFGHALLIAGSRGKIGACVLAARAALRSGLGLLTVHVPDCGYDIIQTSTPEAMASRDINEDYFTSINDVSEFASIGIGPGLGTNSETAVALAKVLKLSKRPLVIDADALNLLSQNKELLDLVPPGSILTPHPGEFERLAGSWGNDFERLELLRAFAQKLNCIVVLKGAYTSIACADGNIYFNSTGNVGMAKGGSGDVLTGILTAILAQGYSSQDAALLGVYIHGLAGDLTERELGQEGMIASDLVEKIPHSFKKLSRV